MISLTGQTKKHQYSPHEKAFYADATTVDFVNPGLTITANSATIASNGTISGYLYADGSRTVCLSIRRARRRPARSASASSPPCCRTAQTTTPTYTTSDRERHGARLHAAAGRRFRRRTSPVWVRASINILFHTKAPTGFDATATHTIGIYGSRNLTAFNLGTNYASTTYNFVPNGAKVTHINDQIKTASCNNCHDQLSAHGGSRRGLDMCVLCHNPQNLDPNTGNSFDAKVFFHKIHMGASLPSVMAGGTYSSDQHASERLTIRKSFSRPIPAIRGVAKPATRRLRARRRRPRI